MPCNTFMRRCFGSGSSDCVTQNIGSSGGCRDRWADCDKKNVIDYAIYPKRVHHPLVYRSADVHVVPFMATSEVLYDSLLRVVPNNQTPATITGIDPLTLFPSAGGTDYDLGDATIPHETIPANSVNIDAFVDVHVPRDSADGVVVDLNELSVFARSIYENQVAEDRDPALPGGGDGQTVQGLAGGTPGTFNDLTDIAGPTGTADFCNGNGGLDVRRLMHVPDVTINNQSRHTVYVVDGFRASNACNPNPCGTANAAAKRVRATFEGVKHQVACKPREQLILCYYPDVDQWRVKDSNARA